MIKVATVCSGIGSPEQALKNIGIQHEISFACEIDKYARKTYLANFNPKMMLTDMTKEDWIGEEYYSDLFVGGIPCQAFSLAGKRLGEADPRGLLFYDFYRYVKNQQPKVFIIENVKGLLSDNDGKTFRNWLQLLGQSENTHLNMFNHPDSLMYNLHYTVLNSKDFGVPQNRERVFIVGIRNDLPNTFRFPKGERLTKRLKDVMEESVDEKYYLSDTMIKSFIAKNDTNKEKGNGFQFQPKSEDDIANCVTARCYKMGIDDNYVADRGIMIAGNLPGYEQRSRVYYVDGISPTLTSQEGGGKRPFVMVGETTNSRIAGWFENENVIGAYRSDSKRSSVSEHIYHKTTGICNTIQTAHVPNVIDNIRKNIRIRRLTPTECFRLQGFPDSFIKPVSETQQYKQAGNSITTFVIEAIIRNALDILKMANKKAA